MKNKSILLILGVIVLFNSGISVINPEIYIPFVDGDYIAESVGQDMMSFVVGLFIIILVLKKKQDNRTKLTILGLLIYLVYAYGIYAFGSVYNILFFNYIGIIGIGLSVIFRILIELFRDQKKNINKHPINRKSTALFLIISSLMFSCIWILSILPHIHNQTIARETVIYVFDLSFILPLFLITGIQLLKKTNYCWYFAIVSMVKALTIGLSIVFGQIVKYIKGYETDFFLAGVFLVFTLIALVLNQKIRVDFE